MNPATELMSRRRARYRTAWMLAAFAAGLFAFTLYSGLR